MDLLIYYWKVCFDIWFRKSCISNVLERKIVVFIDVLLEFSQFSKLNQLRSEVNAKEFCGFFLQ